MSSNSKVIVVDHTKTPTLPNAESVSEIPPCVFWIQDVDHDSDLFFNNPPTISNEDYQIDESYSGQDNTRSGSAIFVSEAGWFTGRWTAEFFIRDVGVPLSGAGKTAVIAPTTTLLSGGSKSELDVYAFDAEIGEVRYSMSEFFEGVLDNSFETRVWVEYGTEQCRDHSTLAASLRQRMLLKYRDIDPSAAQAVHVRTAYQELTPTLFGDNYGLAMDAKFESNDQNIYGVSAGVSPGLDSSGGGISGSLGFDIQYWGPSNGDIEKKTTIPFTGTTHFSDRVKFSDLAEDSTYRFKIRNEILNFSAFADGTLTGLPWLIHGEIGSNVKIDLTDMWMNAACTHCAAVNERLYIRAPTQLW